MLVTSITPPPTQGKRNPGPEGGVMRVNTPIDKKHHRAKNRFWNPCRFPESE